MSCCYIWYRNVAKYYEGQKDIISNIKLEKKSHSFKEKERLLQQQHQEWCETIAIHVRRWDYIKLGLVVCDETYYKQALVSIANKIWHNNIHIYVFSDDDSQTQKELSFLQNYNVTYINFDDYEKTHNIDNKWFDDVEKLIFMSQCKHHIIANSTYSRWWAWLSKNNGIVIAPKMRTRTISSEKVLPSDWIKI